MVKITEDLIRKRAEHNDGKIHSLEELALHQQNLERIEYIEKWCKNLRILYLQNNLISKIENLSKLKKLEYLNLALNNIEKVENLEGCESMKKLDLTVNFVGDLSSIKSLVNVHFLEELYLTGNPCTEYPGYREFVIATLPQLKSLDGIEITKSERIMALQNLQHICPVIDEKQREHEIKRKSEKMEVEQRRQRRSEKSSDAFGLTDQDGEDFWHEKVPYTPESRIEMHERMRMQATLKESKKDSSLKKNEGPKLFAEDGRPYNINRAKIPFSLEDNTLDGQDVYLLSVAVYKYMDTALIECDIRTNYVRVTLKGKILQIALPEEVRPDSSSVKRSLITGHLLITMPKASCEVGKPKYSENKCKVNENNLTKHGDSSGNQHSDSKSPASQNCSNLLLEIEKPSANKNQQAFEKISSEGFRYHMNNNRKPADAKQNRKCTHDCSEVPQLI